MASVAANKGDFEPQPIDLRIFYAYAVEAVIANLDEKHLGVAVDRIEYDSGLSVSKNVHASRSTMGADVNAVAEVVVYATVDGTEIAQGIDAESVKRDFSVLQFDAVTDNTRAAIARDFRTTNPRSLRCDRTIARVSANRRSADADMTFGVVDACAVSAVIGDRDRLYADAAQWFFRTETNHTVSGEALNASAIFA